MDRRTRRSDWNTEQPANGAVGIRKQGNGELELVGKPLMRCDAVCGNSGDNRAGAGEVGGPPAEIACFDGSAGRVVFWIRPDDEQLRLNPAVEEFGDFATQTLVGSGPALARLSGLGE